MMKRMTGQLVAGGLVTGTRDATEVNEISDVAAKFVDDLFEDLKSSKPAWRQSFPDDLALNKAKREWTKAFIENGIRSKFVIAKGKRHVRRTPSPFFPSAGEFVSWCKPSLEDVGLPDVDSAYREACNAGRDHVWSHEAVYLAAVAVGRFDLARNLERLMLPKFKKQYDFYAQKVMRGEVLRVALPKPPPEPVFGDAGEPVKPGEVGGFLKNMRKGLG